MKRFSFCLGLLILLGLGVWAEERPWAITLGFSWDLGPRIGVEYFPSRHFGFRAAVGSSLLSLEGDFCLSFEGCGVYRLIDRREGPSLDIIAGLTDSFLVFTSPLHLMTALGAGLRLTYPLWDSPLDIGIEGGAGYPIYWEDFRLKESNDLIWPHLELIARYSL